jgi:hypothetical protein
MKYIISYLSRLISKDLPKPLGRWNIDYCEKKINYKIYLSNEDHCGFCNEYSKSKIHSQNKIINNMSDNNFIK